VVGSGAPPACYRSVLEVGGNLVGEFVGADSGKEGNRLEDFDAFVGDFTIVVETMASGWKDAV